jgi:siroheme synthase
MDAQRVLHGTVSTLPAMAAQVADGAPGLFIIGKVAALGQELAWFKGMSKLQAAA